MNKYSNCPVTVDGEHYDSKREMLYHQDLKNLQRAGEIRNLKRQPKYLLEVGGMKIATYIADFSYEEKGRTKVVDVKSPITARNPAFKLKQKLMRAIHGIDVEVVL